MVKIRKPTEHEFQDWVKKSDMAQVGDVDFDAGFDGATRDTTLLAFEDGVRSVAGIVFVQHPAHTVTIGLLYVLPEFRGHGIGSRMMDAVYRWAKQRGADQLVLNANPDAKEFYLKYGFDEDPKSDWVRMTKEIVRG